MRIREWGRKSYWHFVCMRDVRVLCFAFLWVIWSGEYCFLITAYKMSWESCYYSWDQWYWNTGQSCCFALLYSASQILHFSQIEKCVSCSVVSRSLPSMDCGPPGYSVHGLPQARILKWVAISFSRGSSQPRDGTHIYVPCIGRRILYH